MTVGLQFGIEYFRIFHFVHVELHDFVVCGCFAELTGLLATTVGKILTCQTKLRKAAVVAEMPTY